VAAPDLPQGDPIRQRLQALGVVVHQVPLRRTGTNPVADVQTLWNLWRLMRRVRPGHMLGYTVKPVIYGSLAAWLAGVPRRFALVTGAGLCVSAAGPGRVLCRPWCSGCMHWRWRGCTLCFFRTPTTRRCFASALWWRRARAPAWSTARGWMWGAFAVAPLPPGPPCFLLIARLLGDKGVREYAQAARRVRALHPGVRCLLVGWIDTNPRCLCPARARCLGARRRD
jgi:hypothetical protein